MTTKQATPLIEGHILVCGAYSHYFAIPHSLASSVLPHIKKIEQIYKDGGYGYELKDVPAEIISLSAEQMTSITVAARLAPKEES